MTPFDGDPDFDARLLPELAAIPFFRAPTDEEVRASHAAYVAGDAERLCDEWVAIAEPTRARLDGVWGVVYRRSGVMPSRVTGLSFLATLRAVLRAGVRFRERLRPAARVMIEREFPWLERRHEHVPDGWAPPLEFPPAFAAFIDAPSLDDARARWALVTALNEVQQSATSRHLARLFRLPELARHAERERELALHYLAHASPPSTERLWRQSLAILDGLNAAVFAGVVRSPRVAAWSLARALTPAGAREWRAFVDGIDRPQVLPT